MTDDELEIESWRYSGRAFFVLPLSSGRIAILCPNRQLYRVVDDWELAKSIGPHAENYQTQQSFRVDRMVSNDVVKLGEGLDLDL